MTAGELEKAALRSTSHATKPTYRLSRVVARTVAAQATTMTSLSTGEAFP
jgi:hypothetical protein